MGIKLQDKTIIEPDLTDVLINFKQDIFATLNCAKVGEIESFNPTNKTAQIQVLFKRVLRDGTAESLPILVDCPVFTIQGGGGSLQFPIAAGDQCIVLFSDRRLDEWYQNGAEAAPADGRMHDLSDGIALVGINALNSDLPIAPNDKVLMTYQNSSIEIVSDGLKLIGTGGAEVDLAAAKIKLKNSTTDLLVLLNGLIDVIKGLQVVGPIALTAASIASLEAYKTNLATLLD